MNLPEIREKLKVILSAVAGTGIVHDRERYSNDAAKFLSLFKEESSGRINGCIFTREKFARQQRTQGSVEKAHVFVIRRVMGVKDDDDTAIMFDKNIDDILDALEAPETLNEGDDTTAPDWGPMAGAVGAQLEISEPRMFGGVLCHYSEMRICVCSDD
ncbi:MAG: hypothetical protein LLG40_15735 [Deltaproteobacteria bacterium]|nr:hypothetical protein [Deltaproteobacteria bacterium]